MRDWSTVQTVTLSRFEIATIQLDRAIELMLDKGDCICAITLAGAADEIFAKIVINQGIRKIDSTSELKEYLANKSGLTTKQVNDEHLNRIRNNLKHYGDGTPVTLLPVDEAVQIVARALVSMHDACGGLTDRGRQFLVWTRRYETWLTTPTG